MTADPFRLYLDPDEIGLDGYPYAWHGKKPDRTEIKALDLPGGSLVTPVTFAGKPIGAPLKDLVRERDGNRCLRCGHPYTKGSEQNSPRSEWSPCDMQCSHVGPMRVRWTNRETEEWGLYEDMLGVTPPKLIAATAEVQAQWRILTVHHLNGIKVDCRWFNLVSLCQRDHLYIQSAVVMERPYHYEHSEWFKPFAAGFYAAKYLGVELSQEQTMERLDELLGLEKKYSQGYLF